MTRVQRPGVLVVAGDGVQGGHIARILEEAGIVATAVSGAAAARAAAATMRFDLAVIAAEASASPAEPGLEAALRARKPGLQCVRVAAARLFCADSGFASRRFLGQVREQLLGGTPGGEDPAGEARAEACIAAAKLACLHRRRGAARAAGARRAVAELRREIGETAAQREMLLWRAAHSLPRQPAAGPPQSVG